MHLFFVALTLTALSAVPAWSQFREIDIRFEGIGCASCIESLPGRLQRIRGVESVKVDPEKSTVEVRLAQSNRVKIEQVRDAIEQDGTKTISARVLVRGVVRKDGDKWLLAAGAQTYELAGGEEWSPGEATVEAAVEDLHPRSGRLQLKARS